MAAQAVTFRMRRTMQARMKNPATSVPGAYDALQALHRQSRKPACPNDPRAHEPPRQPDQRVQRVRRHALPCAEEARREGHSESSPVATWRETPYFSEAERAALALTEAATRLSDRADPVPDEVWKEAAEHYDERQLGALVMSIGLINLWNRLNAATRQVGGDLDRPVRVTERRPRRCSTQSRLSLMSSLRCSPSASSGPFPSRRDGLGNRRRPAGRSSSRRSCERCKSDLPSCS